MTNVAKKAGLVLLSLAFALGVTMPALLIAQVNPAIAQAEEAEPAAEEQPDGTNTGVGTCTAYIQYLENPGPDVPDEDLDETGRLLLGTRVINGLHEGDVLHAWDYVEDIPGHFFFDGWPLDLTVTANPDDNVMKLMYINMYNSEYTVNYYVMTGADLTADTWGGALASDGVAFTKLGSETFDNQRFNKLVEGDAYEYKLNGMYVIDTYPSQIRLGVDPDDNVINVLYTDALSVGPTDTEIIERPGATTPDKPSVPSTPETPGTPDADAPTISDTPNGSESDGVNNGAATPDLPSDTTFTEDEILAALPDGAEAELIQDFTGAKADLGSSLSQTGDSMAPWLIGSTVVAAAALAVILLALFWHKGSKPKQDN